MAKQKEKVFRVTLVFPLGDSRSVFIKANNRSKAEKKALRKYPSAIQIDRSPFPQN
jgi:hypothetical protein